MTLVPPNASPLSRILDEVYAERLAAIEMPIRDLGDPERCPRNMLSYLAWALSVDQWDEGWPEHIKRKRCADALTEHRIKGSVVSVESVISGFGASAQIKEWFQKTPRATPGTCEVWMTSQQNNVAVSVLKTSDESWVFGRQAIPVQPNRKYRVRLAVRQISDEPGQISAGLVTLDGGFQSISGGAGLHRYCCVSNATLSKESGWQVFEGTICGIGEDHHTFRPGTVYVRPMCVTNFQGNGTTHVAELSLFDMVENRQLQENSDFSLGKSGWSLQFQGETVTEDVPGILQTDHKGLTASLQEDVVRAVASTKPSHIHFQVKAGVSASTSLNIAGMARLLNFQRLEMVAQ